MTTTKVQPGNVISGREAAKRLGVHFTTLYRWVKKKKIVYITFGNNIFIPEMEVERLQNLKRNSHQQ